MIRAEVKFARGKEEDGAVVFRSWLEDQDGNRLTNAEVARAFRNFNITGVHVKAKPGALDLVRDKDFPAFAKIVLQTDDYVVLEGGHQVPREEFHSLYTLD